MAQDPLTSILIRKALANPPAMEGTVKDPGALIDRQAYTIPPNIASSLQTGKPFDAKQGTDMLMTNRMYRASMGMPGTGIPLDEPPDASPFTPAQTGQSFMDMLRAQGVPEAEILRRMRR